FHYRNVTGRNDIVSSKVARDQEYVYFYVETAAPITQPDTAWMQLYINSDRDKNTGWEGYDFVINRRTPGKKAILEKTTAAWNWKEVGELDYAVRGNKLEIKVPRAFLGDGDLNFEFKWQDNMQRQGDIMDFYLSGDT